ncbi:MAG: cupin domain-containing protein [bacterium]
MTTRAELARLLELAPHPEGGRFRECYRAAGRTTAHGGERAWATSILYMLEAGERSRFHRLRSDELWHFHLGGPLELCEIAPDGTARSVVLGPEVTHGQRLFHAVPAGSWFAAAPLPETEFSLLGCTVAPGFEFADFELADAPRLAADFPHLAPLIRKHA